ncbi:hypothetical protein GGF50DRAFT_68462, partial [Schizophyllum commune]
MNNDHLSATHARWLEAVLAHNIIDVRHIPGSSNVVSDGLSRRDTGRARGGQDGSSFDVSPDWFAESGLAFDIHGVTAGGHDYEALKSRFATVPLFRQVVEALETIEKGADGRELRRAQHRAQEYMIEDGRLWHVGGGRSRRARPRAECLSAQEMRKKADEQHLRGGHMLRDNMKVELMDRYRCPGLDKIIMDSIMA